MKHLTPTAVFRLALAGSLASFPAFQPAMAQQSASGKAQGIEEITVTARRTSERIEDVPLNLTAFSGDTLEKLHITDLTSLSKFTPNLSYSNQGGMRYTQQVNIRGLTGGSFGASKASVFVDGIYLASGWDSVPLSVLERVEVLKGPQSAAFGRATFSGAVNYVTKEPSAELTGNVVLQGAQRGAYDVHGFVSGPVTDELRNQLRYQLTASSQRTDGGWKNQPDGTRLGYEKTEIIGGKILWSPMTNLNITPYFFHTSARDGVPVDQAYLDPALRNGRFVKPDGTIALYPVGELPTQNFDNRFRYDLSHFDNPGLRTTVNRGGVDIAYLISDYTLKLTASHTKNDTHVQSDYGGQNTGSLAGMSLPLLFFTDTRDTDKQGELRLISPKLGPLQFSTGLYYIDLSQLTYSRGWIGINACCSGTPQSFRWFINGAKDKSVFASLNYDILPNLSLTAEGRYQSEEATANTFAANGSHVDYAATFKSFLPRLSLLYKLTPNLNVYATYSKGTSPGGFNATNLLPDESFRTFQEEKLYNYELGAKSTWLDGRLSASVAAYHMDWKDMQTTGTYYLPNLTNVAVVENRGTAKVDGVEAEVQVVPLSGLRVRGALGYNKTKYGAFCSPNLGALLGRSDAPAPNVCVYVTGNRIERTPDWSGALSVDYTQGLGGEWDGYVGGDAQYVGRVYTNETNLNWLKPVTTFNVRVGARWKDFFFEVFVNNATDEDAPATAISQVDLVLNSSSQFGQHIREAPRAPRQFGSRVGWSF